LVVFSQELPPIEKFTSDHYVGDNQNWMVSQDKERNIYVANNKGLLVYNGAKWKTYNSPNKTIIRAVNAIENKIYTGCYAELGYWEKNRFGDLIYTSLIDKLEKNELKGKQIWNILSHNDWVVFQASNDIYFYNTKTKKIKVISSKRIIYKIFKVANKIYYHVDGEGVYVVENGSPKLIINDAVTKTDRVINIFQKNQGLIIITRSSGLFHFKNNVLKSWVTPVNSVLKTVSVFSSIELKDGSFVIGTVSDGLLHLDNNGALKYQFNQKNGLTNNTVLALFEDDTNNVWAALDNGVNCINVKSPVRAFIDYEGVLGTVYTTQAFKNHLYVGTNQGLFYRVLDEKNSTFKFVEGTAGQVWELFNLNNEHLFCGHHFGTFIIENNKAEKISNELGTWAFRQIPKHKDYLLQGNYNGLFVLEKLKGKWHFRNKVEGFDNSSRYFEINSENQVWVNHEYKGVFKLKLNDSLTKVDQVASEKSIPLGESSSLVKYRDKILYASEYGVFKYSEENKGFELDSLLSNIIDKKEYISGRLVVDKTGRLWGFSINNLSYIENDDVTNASEIINIPIPLKFRKGILGFENISKITPSTYVLGTANGYITIDLEGIHKTEKHLVYLNSIVLHGNNDGIVPQAINSQGVFKFKYGLLELNYAVPEYQRYLDVKYQYILEGYTDKWSKWDTNAKVAFENLPFGAYTFKVRAKSGNTPSKNVATYTFEISRPWYLTNMAVLLYILLFFLIIFITHKAYKRYYIKKFEKEQLESQQLIMRIKNEKLNSDINSKNRELAISTMSIIKKNKVLNKIKKEIKNSKDSDNIAAIKLIDNNLNDNKDWDFFEKAFNNADKDFFDKIKKEHPDLTPNDLRFCAYLRLNLSSKEMAPLLNISTKSVETKRYRLRKKLGLEHDSGLVNYMLKF
jgi:ligand-binding sensor domain-containing protein/DNA-binding CsgD family transcriptional regulator